MTGQEVPNAEGAPRHRTNLWVWFTTYMNMTADERARMDRTKLAAAQETALKMVEKAVQGRGFERLARYIVDREEGKAAEHVIKGGTDLSGAECEELRKLPQAWLEERIRALPDTDAVFCADLNDNRRSRGGFIPDAKIDALIAEWPVEIQATRIAGHFAASLGAVFQTFRREVHVCSPFPVPEDWPRWRSIDFGFAHPFVCLWLALDPDRRWYVYAEHYQARESLAFHAARIKDISGREQYCSTWADHDAQDRFELEEHGIRTTAARKDVHLGIEAVQTVLKIQGDGRPRLQISRTCPHLIAEVIGYRWARGTEITDPKDEPWKVNDHAVDALRYAIFGVEGNFLDAQTGV